jgi:hypothetical protein
MLFTWLSFELLLKARQLFTVCCTGRPAASAARPSPASANTGLCVNVDMRTVEQTHLALFELLLHSCQLLTLAIKGGLQLLQHTTLSLGSSDGCTSASTCNSSSGNQVHTVEAQRQVC